MGWVADTAAGTVPETWSQLEVVAIVADYFAMYQAELRQEPYNKTEHRRQIAPLLNNRSDGSIERKHQNISAILIDLGMPYIAGYKPLRNYQTLLRDVVEEQVQTQPEVTRIVEEDVHRPVEVPAVGDILNVLVQPPVAEPAGKLRERPVRDYRAKQLRKVDYLVMEARNASQGDAGERFVMNFERARLMADGQDHLADKVERISESMGDGAGFDILSFETDGRDRFVEVKTTKYGKETPFYLTRNEVGFSAVPGI